MQGCQCWRYSIMVKVERSMIFPLPWNGCPSQLLWVWMAYLLVQLPIWSWLQISALRQENLNFISLFAALWGGLSARCPVDFILTPRQWCDSGDSFGHDREALTAEKILDYGLYIRSVKQKNWKKTRQVTEEAKTRFANSYKSYEKKVWKRACSAVGKRRSWSYLYRSPLLSLRTSRKVSSLEASSDLR